GCTTCIRNCPTEAIRVRKGRAHILEERCIDCGNCIRSCPHGAKKALSDPLSLIRDHRFRVALPAPSLYGQYDGRFGSREMAAGLRALGFDEVLDVAVAAERVTLATSRLLADGGLRPLISSACPAILRLIQLRFPSLIPNLVPLLPPMEVAARAARERFPGSPDEVGVFFISPCAGKVTMARSPLGYERSAIDGVIGIKEIYLPLMNALLWNESGASGKASGQVEPGAALPSAGLAWCRPEGEIDALSGRRTLAVDGIGKAIALFESLENGMLGDIEYIEALACPSGCLGGPLTVENPALARSRIRHLERSSIASGRDHAQAPQGIPIVDQEALRWNVAVEPRPALILHRDIRTGMAMMEKMDAIAQSLPGLDCGSCGAPGCQALAEDIVRGVAVETDCIFKLRENVRELAQKLLALEELKPPGLDKD
ncbi:MAG: [Fe-Fe] hydrogenase large subunit C-terminal domain-containing protein, partial [Spirochaetota bacterium]